jgi:hypothetical protein
MAKSHGRPPRPPRKAGILSRDETGAEHLLFVSDHPVGFISVSDDTMVRILTPSALVQLILELTHALGSSIPARPFSGGY